MTVTVVGGKGRGGSKGRVRSKEKSEYCMLIVMGWEFIANNNLLTFKSKIFHFFYVLRENSSLTSSRYSYQKVELFIDVIL